MLIKRGTSSRECDNPCQEHINLEIYLWIQASNVSEALTCQVQNSSQKLLYWNVEAYMAVERGGVSMNSLEDELLLQHEPLPPAEGYIQTSQTNYK